jgi:TolA-binding protein
LPEDPGVCERIAEVLIERHKAREGLSLLRNLHKRFPEYPGIPRAYLAAARAFSEELGQVEPAQQLLAFIRQRYPTFEQMGEVVQLESVLAKLGKKSG